jgi:histidine triad (HIT) family protein
MYNHAPQDYVCPICLGINGIENEQTLIRQSDIVLKNDFITAFISSFFIGQNNGHVVIVPNQHFENIYDIPLEDAHAIFDASQKIALALKEAYKCEGITILQNNEPAGNQHAFHYHMHVFPRYANDNLHENMMNKKLTTPEERLPFAEKLKEALK